MMMCFASPLPWPGALFIGHPTREAARIGMAASAAGGVETMARGALLQASVMSLQQLVQVVAGQASRLDLLTVEPKGRLRTDGSSLRA